MFRKLCLFFILIFLNNCTLSSSAFLGPVYTGAKTGSIYQSSLSYGSGRAFKMINEEFNDVKTFIIDSSENAYKKINQVSDPLIISTYKIQNIEFSELEEPEPLP
tara:strand:- start:494 stop:808 length:315 start_codon:yes stop_codon:yes gene_type:complete